MAPLLAAISESLTPTNPFKDVGLGHSPYQKGGQAVMFMFEAAPSSQHFVTLSAPFWELIRRVSAHLYGGIPFVPILTFRAEAGFALHVAFCCIELLSPLQPTLAVWAVKFFSDQSGQTERNQSSWVRNGNVRLPSSSILFQRTPFCSNQIKLDKVRVRVGFVGKHSG